MICKEGMCVKIASSVLSGYCQVQKKCHRHTHTYTRDCTDVHTFAAGPACVYKQCKLKGKPRQQFKSGSTTKRLELSGTVAQAKDR